jgi:sporulation protein YlmC with PRC-barrel domain
MDIQLEAPVVTSDGADAGKINKVVFDPNTSETKSIIVHAGGIFGRNVAVPIDVVRVAAPTRVELTWTKSQFEAEPDFVEENYVYPPETWVAPYGWASGSVLWPGGYLPGVVLDNPALDMTKEQRERLREEDENNALVGQGAEVVAMDGTKVGSVDNLMVDPVSHKPSRVVMKRGFLFTEDVELPGDWIQGYDDGKVTLNVDKVTVEQLAKRRD